MPHANYVHPTIEFFEPAGMDERVIAKFDEALAALTLEHGKGKRIRTASFGDGDWQRLVEAALPVIEWSKMKN